jgi:hypothetical protein
MSDPRNVAHAKKVTQEKHHHQAKGKPGKEKRSAVRSRIGRLKLRRRQQMGRSPKRSKSPVIWKKSLAVLSKLKDLEFHSRANIETLAELSLTIEEELKQREFAEAIGALYSAQEAFHSKIAAFIETYQTKCESLK